MTPASFARQRIVVKLGTSLLTGGGEHLDLGKMAALVAQVARLHDSGTELIIVSSGAIAAGRSRLGLAQDRGDIPYRQVLAAVGQSVLMNTYDRLFSEHGITVAQALLTKADLSDRSGYLNARNTLLSLIELQVIAIVNENDVVATDEIQAARFGDNDNLSAMVANLVDADLLLILTNTGGLYTTDPHLDPKAMLIPEVTRIDAEIERLATGTPCKLGTGGMVTKLEAARLATASGVTMVIADGHEPDVLLRLAGGERLGTRFPAASSELGSRQRWLMSGLCTRGTLVVDDGAARAIGQAGRSLLPAGITGVEGSFERGDIVRILDADGTSLGYGISNYSSTDIASLLYHDYGPEVVHRNNLATV